MAEEDISSVEPLFSEAVGARRWVCGTVTFPAKYKVEGCTISEKQLKELGLTNGLVDAGWVVTSGKAAKNVEQVPMQLNITNPGATPTASGTQSEQVVTVQCYETITTEINKELELEGIKMGSAIATVLLIGR